MVTVRAALGGVGSAVAGDAEHEQTGAKIAGGRGLAILHAVRVRSKSVLQTAF
jgi:hypothetical protein